MRGRGPVACQGMSTVGSVRDGLGGRVLANELVRLICLSQKSPKSLTPAINSVSNLVFAIIEPVSHACY